MLSLVENSFFKKNPLHDLLSSVNAVISTNERIEFITGHMTYSPAYTYLNLPDNSHPNYGWNEQEAGIFYMKKCMEGIQNVGKQ